MKTKNLLSVFLIAGSVCSASASMMRSPVRPESSRLFLVSGSPVQTPVTRNDAVDYEEMFWKKYTIPAITNALNTAIDAVKASFEDVKFLKKLVDDLKERIPDLPVAKDDIQPYMNDALVKPFASAYQFDMEKSLRAELFAEGSVFSNAIVELIALVKRANAEDQITDKKILLSINRDRYEKRDEMREEAQREAELYLERYKPTDVAVPHVVVELIRDENGPFMREIVKPRVSEERRRMRNREQLKSLFPEGLVEEEEDEVGAPEAPEPVGHADRKDILKTAEGAMDDAEALLDD